MDNRHPLFEWSPGYEIDGNEPLIMEEDNKKIEYDTESNGGNDVV